MMNEISKHDCAHDNPELTELNARIVRLEAQIARLNPAANPTSRRKTRKKLIYGLAPFVGLVLLIGSVLYGQGAGDALFIDAQGWVGIGTNAPKATLDVVGKLNVSDNTTLSNASVAGYLTTAGNVGIGTTNPGAKLEVTGDTRFNGAVGINRGAIQSQHLVITPASGNIPFNVTDPANSTNWLSVFSNGNVIMNGGSVGIGTANPEAKLDVVGDTRIRGKVSSYARYQRDDQTESTYDASPRYHLSLTALQYGGRTRSVPQIVLEDLCGDQDGCEFRLAMTRWSSDKDTESASRSGVFYYSKTDGHWRASFGESDAIGVDGDGTTQHVRNIWSTCFFTDGTYSQYKDQGDNQRGMQLLVWNNYKGATRTCEMTLID
jgi:hypothetical protein